MAPGLCLDHENSTGKPQNETRFPPNADCYQERRRHKLCRDRQTVAYADIVRCFPSARRRFAINGLREVVMGAADSSPASCVCVYSIALLPACEGRGL